MLPNNTDNKLDIFNETNTQIPDLRILDLKNAILGEHFELQISLLLPKNSKKINKKQRKKDYVPNTLSFKYSSNSGEIVMTPEVIEAEIYSFTKDKKEIDLTNFKDKFAYLLIHSMLHLTDLDHGEKMEKLEAQYLTKML